MSERNRFVTGASRAGLVAKALVAKALVAKALVAKALVAKALVAGALVVLCLAGGPVPAAAAQDPSPDEPSEFGVQGERARGTTVPDGAPPLPPGRYVDTAPRDGEAKHYILRRSHTGSTVYAGVTAHPAGPAPDDLLELQLWTVAGTACGSAAGHDSDIGAQNSLATVAVSSAATALNALAGGAGEADRYEACANATELHLVVEAAYGESSLADEPIELVVIEEPGIDTDAPQLPGPVDNGAEWGPPMPIEERATVTAGATFASAPQLISGAYTSSIQPGDVQLYRVRIDWGRRLRVELGIDEPDAELAEQLASGPHLDIRVLAPTRAEVGVDFRELPEDVTGRVRPNAQTRLTQMTYDVRYRNREAVDRPLVAATSLAGDYYIAIALAEDPAEQRYAVPYQLDVAVDDTSDGIAPLYLDPGRVAGPVTEPPVLPADPGADIRAMAATGLLGAGLLLLLLGTGSILLSRRTAA